MKSSRLPWTHEQIQEFLPRLKEKILKEESISPNIRPLPPMTVDECQQYFYRLADIAGTRTLTGDECGMLGQLLSVFQQAVRAETMGKTGRFFVISEEEVNRMTQAESE